MGALDADNNFIDMTDPKKTSGYLRVAALAAILDKDASAENCVVESSKIYGTRCVGAMFGISRGDVNNCNATECEIYGLYPGPNAGGYSSETVNPCDIGGIIGWIQSGIIKNCYVKYVDVKAWLTNAGYNIGGFAGSVSSNVTEPKIYKCNVKNTYVSGYHDVGGFAGWITGGSIEESNTDAEVKAYSAAGGFAGQNGGSSMVADAIRVNIGKCSASGSVTAVMAGGGFVGTAINSTTSDSYATGDVKVTGTFTGWNLGPAGGFVGKANGKAGFVRCYATGDVSAKKGAGGFVGNSMIKYGQTSVLDYPSRDYPHQAAEYGGYAECYATGNVTTTDKFGISAAGGFAGQLQDNSVPADCYATGNVSGYKNVGGFVGSVYDCGALNCYYSGQISCDTDTAGGFVGYI